MQISFLSQYVYDKFALVLYVMKMRRLEAGGGKLSTLDPTNIAALHTHTTQYTTRALYHDDKTVTAASFAHTLCTHVIKFN